MAAHKIGELLTATGEFKSLSRLAHRQAELERLLSQAAPRALSEATRVKGLRAGMLIVSADNAAVAAKLRQLVPRLLMHISERDPEVTGIRIEVQPAAPPPGRPAASAKQVIGPAAIADFEKVAAALPDSPLKAAVSRLVQRHKKKSREP